MKISLIILISCFMAIQNLSLGKVSIAYETRNFASEIQIDRTVQRLAMSWDLETKKRAKITFALNHARALIESLRFESEKASKTILQKANPEFQLFIG